MAIHTQRCLMELQQSSALDALDCKKQRIIGPAFVSVHYEALKRLRVLGLVDGSVDTIPRLTKAGKIAANKCWLTKED